MTSTRYRHSPEALHADVGEDVVALQVQRGQCFGMEKVTADVWRLLDEELTLDEICERLISDYDVEPEICRADVAQLLDTMRNEGLIEAID